MSNQPSKTDHQLHRHRTKLSVLLIVLLAVGIWGVVSRIHAASTLHKETDAEATPTVVVIKVAASPATEEVVLPGNVQAWHEAPIYARVNGYLKSWSTDIGAHVKEGDQLAEIETPETDAQLHQAEADLATAEANNQLSQSTAKRWLALLKTNSVSKQETEEKTGDAAAKQALVDSARANLDRLHQEEGFRKVLAPFDGIITARNTDTGALINAGSSGTGPELFHIVDTGKLRTYVQVPENYTAAITPNMTAELHFTEYPQRTFTGTLVETANALDPVTRTLLVELEVDNEKGELLPGSYVEVHFNLPSNSGNVHIPVNTLLFRAAGLQVATVDASGKALLKNITIGRDYGKVVEVTSGLTADEPIIINPPDSLQNGQAVKVVTADQKDKSNSKSDEKDKDQKAAPKATPEPNSGDSKKL